MVDVWEGVPPEARRELSRFIRDTDPPLAIRGAVSWAFLAGFGSGVNVTCQKFKEDLSSIRDGYADLRTRMEAGQ